MAATEEMEAAELQVAAEVEPGSALASASEAAPPASDGPARVANRSILCVDDDLLILSGFQRQLSKKFEMVGALGGEKALKLLREKGPFAVIVTDLQMPGMNGLAFLAKAREVSPESVQIILSGKADLNTAIAAVNEGKIFRFLTKPCSPGTLTSSFEAALAQYELVMTRKELLKNNVDDSVMDAIFDIEEKADRGRQRLDESMAAPKFRSTDPARSTGVDATTGLPDAGEAEAAIQTVITSGESIALAVFCVLRMKFNQVRFGSEVCKKVMLVASQHLAVGLDSLGATLFRWKGSAFVALVPSAQKSPGVLRAELQVAASLLGNQYIEGPFRSVYLPIRIATELVPLQNVTYPDLIKQIDHFVSRVADD